jgi:predicted transcriptional regulator
MTTRSQSKISGVMVEALTVQRDLLNAQRVECVKIVDRNTHVMQECAQRVTQAEQQIADIDVDVSEIEKQLQVLMSAVKGQ